MSATPESRRLLLLDADVRTGDPARPRAAALAAVDGRIVAVGDAATARARLGPGAREVGLSGRVVTPGFHDAHTHLDAWARARARLSLAGAATFEDVLARVRARHTALPAGAWLWGEAFAPYSTWSAPIPHRAALDAAAPGRPVVLWTRDLHAGLASKPRAAAPLAPVFADLARFGITCVHDFGDAAAWERLCTLRDAGELTVRVAFAFVRAGFAGGADPVAISAAVRAARAAADERLWPWALKAFADGSLGARTAHLLAPYAGGDDRGLATLTAAELDALSAEAKGLGLTLAVHAIGDAAVRATLDAFTRWDAPARTALRPRVEHAQLVAPADLSRFGAPGVVASMQPTHAASDRAVAERLWGARDREGGYAWRQLEAAGARLAFGSDVPIESADPRLGMHAALTGGDAAAHARGDVPARALSVERALAAFTGGAAWAIGREERLGRLAPGAAADWVVWGSDPFAAQPAEWPGLAIQETWVDGVRVHPRGAAV